MKLKNVSKEEILSYISRVSRGLDEIFIYLSAYDLIAKDNDDIKIGALLEKIRWTADGERKKLDGLVDRLEKDEEIPDLLF